MKLEDLVRVSAGVAATSGRLEKISRLADFLRQLEPDEVQIAIGFLTGWPRQGKLGVGWATLASVREQTPGRTATEDGELVAAEIAREVLALRDVDAGFELLKAVKGKQSGVERLRLLNELFARATLEEQQFLTGLVMGEVRQGALEGVLLEAVAKAAGLPATDVRRAAMMAGDLGVVAKAALGEGAAGLERYGLELFRPVQPMLADSASTLTEALTSAEGADIAAVSVEWKLDGARIQVHKQGDRVAVYTRNLNDVTVAVPEIVESVLSLAARELILDGETIALTPDGKPLPFQDTMHRFGRRLDVERLRAELPLSAFYFDVLLHDGESLVDTPLAERLQRLDQAVPERLRVPRLVTANADEAARFQSHALETGHEGVMVKSLAAPYAAGRRGSAWLKVKTARTLDLVVLAAEWGSGRRKGWLSNLHLGARDPAGGFVMLGKTFKGMTDEILRWQTTELLAREMSREGHIVYVRPELVVETAFNEVQRSSQYPGGVALRFARIKRYRPDRTALDADTIDAVRAFLP
ncbi:MAG TPA: ATP-dependent DNA ligase [Gemmatimonadaceae bacterium]|nr:ATP-dependent DNA ligase [Gemmatimonadaceae bacterium]